MTDDATGSPPGKVNAAQLGDADLVLRTRSGDRAAFAELWRRHQAAGRALAVVLGSDMDADRLVEEAFARAYRAILSGGGPTGAFRSYLFTTLRSVAASRATTSGEAAVPAVDPLPDPATGQQSTADALDRSLTHRAFRSLPSRWQEVLWYSEIEQLTPGEIAPLLGIASSAVARLTSRAREGLRESWIRVHLDSVDAGSDCRWTIERLDRFARHDLSRRDHARIDAHVARCARCAVPAGDANEVSHRLALVLLPLTLGVHASAAYLASVQGGDVPTFEQPVAMPDAVMEAPGALAGEPEAGASEATGIGASIPPAAPIPRHRARTAAGGIRSRGTVAGLAAAGVILAGAVAAAAVILPALSPPSEVAETPRGEEPRAEFVTGEQRGAPTSRPSPSPSDLPTLSPTSAPPADAVPAVPPEGTATAPESAAPSSPADASDPATTDPAPVAPTDPVPPDPGLPEGTPVVTGTRSAATPSAAEAALSIDVSGAPGATVQARIRGGVVDAAPLGPQGAATLTLRPSAHDIETDVRVELRYVAGDRMGRPLGVRLSELLP